MLIHNFLLELYAENKQNNEHGQAKEKEKRGNRSSNCVAILKWTETVKFLGKCRESTDINQE